MRFFHCVWPHALLALPASQRSARSESRFAAVSIPLGTFTVLAAFACGWALALSTTFSRGAVDHEGFGQDSLVSLPVMSEACSRSHKLLLLGQLTV